ncbi:MAG: hypothetical protein WC405_17850 [Syntrophales bacterium]
MKYQCPKCGENQRSHLTCLVDRLRCESCDTTFIIDEGCIDLCTPITVEMAVADFRSKASHSI